MIDPQPLKSTQQLIKKRQQKVQALYENELLFIRVHIEFIAYNSIYM